jgi:hypothetical protein
MTASISSFAQSTLTHRVQSPTEISDAAMRLRRTVAEVKLSPHDVIAVFESWAKKLHARQLDDAPGIPFLRMWLRRGTLEPIIARELGPNGLCGGWHEHGRAQSRAFPLGIVGHWPAGNVEIQPILSMTCALLGGNAALMRVPNGLVEFTERVMEILVESDPGEVLTQRIFMAAFEHDRRDLHEAMAKVVDGAMIWGGEEAVLQIRSLPFPHWAKVAVFGPRISVAAMDAATWGDPQVQDSWCRRIARDVWQFDQQACSSPQVLFLEKKVGQAPAQFLEALRRAFEIENAAHPRNAIAGALTSAICHARASWLFQDTAHKAIFPEGPDWTLLVGRGSDVPQPVQGKTLAVLEVDDLKDAVSKFDGNVQTLGLGMAHRDKEAELALMAGGRGVDRIVKLGQMHVFGSPWDGVDLIRPMVRIVRHVCSTE